jgi:hypothetical protein
MPACLMVINFALPKPEERARGMHLFFLMTRSCSPEVRYLILTVCHSEIHHFDELVLSISSKSGGKNGTHCWVPEVSSMTAISYAPSQLFEHFIGRQFRAIQQAQALLQVKQFALVPATSFLCVLENEPQKIMDSENLQISASDADRFDRYSRNIQNIKSAIKHMASKPRKGKAPAHDDSGSEEFSDE